MAKKTIPYATQAGLATALAMYAIYLRGKKVDRMQMDLKHMAGIMDQASTLITHLRSEVEELRALVRCYEPDA